MFPKRADKIKSKYLCWFICLIIISASLFIGCGSTQISRGTEASSKEDFSAFEKEKDSPTPIVSKEPTRIPLTPTPEPTQKPTPQITKNPSPQPTQMRTQEPQEEIQTPSTQTEPTKEPEAEITYVVNTNTKKFHKPSCSSVKDIKNSNRWDFTGERQELIDKGYVPCKRCNP